jgi:hypothetical protein
MSDSKRILITAKSYLIKILNKNGGDDRSRTCDFLNANQALSQLSYIPIELGCGDRI